MKKHGYTVLGGFCMVLADSVPGVSGGTIAFLMGFYDAFVGSLDAVVHGTKQERLLGPLYLLKLAAGWVVGMALAVTVLAGAFTDGIYQLSYYFSALCSSPSRWSCASIAPCSARSGKTGCRFWRASFWLSVSRHCACPR